MEDFTAFRHTLGAGPSPFQSHAEFLEAATIRYAISSQMHSLTIAELTMVRDLITLINEEKAATHPDQP